LIVAAFALAAPAFLRGWRLGCGYFLRRRESYRLSEAGFFVTRLQFAAGGAIALGGMATGAAWAMLFSAVHLLAPQYLEGPRGLTVATPPIEPVKVETTAARSVQVKPANRASVKQAAADQPMNAGIEAVAAQTYSDAKARRTANAKQSAQSSCAESRQAVARLEAEQQYSGDDEIVRARLGLPPKPTCSD